LAYYFKVEYASPENVKIWRAIAWTSFLSNKIEQAKKFLNKAIQSKEEWTDYLHLGHIAFIQKNKKEAISNYQKAFVLTENDLTTFIELFNQDYPYLIEKGIDAMDIAILMDYLRYSVE
jgi:tetratricopeptide (TPR) repeat protein